MDRNGITIRVASPEEVAANSSGGRIAKYGIGKKCRGKVVNFKPYGFFVETADGGFGLVHGRNIKGWDWSQRFERVFRHGSEVDLTVIDIEEETNRMSFSCEMPEAAVDAEPEPGAVEDAAPPQPSREEIAQKWAEDNPEQSAAARAWLAKELADGPLYGPLTNVLCDRFGVPVPASRWIRLFPEFTCYSGKGDNPSDLPSVSLSARAGDVAYWGKIKIRNDDLLEARNQPADDSAELGRLAKRLDAQAAFPSAREIRGVMSMAHALARGRAVYGVTDTVERLAIPMLGLLGWDVSPDNVALVRGGGTTFHVKIYGGTAQSGNVAIAVLCAPAGTDFSSLRGGGAAERDVVEQTLGLYNQLSGDDPTATKVVWTNGTEWIVFPRELLSECIGILAEHRGAEILDQLAAGPETSRLRRVTLPSSGAPFAWLAAFADLYDLIGCRPQAAR